MRTLRDSVYLLVAIGSIGMAAWQPSEADVVRQVAQSAQPVQKVALDLEKGTAGSGRASVGSSR